MHSSGDVAASVCTFPRPTRRKLRRRVLALLVAAPVVRVKVEEEVEVRRREVEVGCAGVLAGFGRERRGAIAR